MQMAKAWKRGSAALAAGAIIAVGMVATQPAPSASAAKRTTATKATLGTKTKTVRLMICDKGKYHSTTWVWRGDPRTHGYLGSRALRSDEVCEKYALVQNQEYTVRVAVWSVEKNRATKTVSYVVRRRSRL